jgi:DinB superfamily
MPPLAPIIQYLARAQAGLLQAADAVSPEEWKKGPGGEAWSAAELVAHLIVVEKSIIGRLDRIAQQPPEQLPWRKKLHLPLALVSARLIRRKSPLPPDPRFIREKEDMLAELREVRGRTLAFLEETSKRDLSSYHWKHPFVGMLNAYDWFQFIAAHEIRHSKQMQELAVRLRKAVASLQK